MSPLLKYPGGKDKELCHILPNLPSNAENYYEPFVGGGAVYFAVKADKYFINDKSFELMELYDMFKTQNAEFLCALKQIDHNWQIVSNVVINHAEDTSKIIIV